MRKSVPVAILFAALSASALAQDRGSCLETKDYLKAIKACSEIIRSHPKDASAYLMRGAVLARNGDLGQAIADYNKAIEINPRYAAAYNSRAEAFVAKGDYARAVADVTKAGELGSQKAQPAKPKVVAPNKPRTTRHASTKPKDKEQKTPFNPFEDRATP